LLAFIASGLLVAIPSILLIVALETSFYNKLTFVPYLFLKKNIIERVSEDFGVSPTNDYVYNLIPNELNYLWPLVYIAIAYAVYESISKR
jgi:hypothetical protein